MFRPLKKNTLIIHKPLSQNEKRTHLLLGLNNYIYVTVTGYRTSQEERYFMLLDWYLLGEIYK